MLRGLLFALLLAAAPADPAPAAHMLAPGVISTSGNEFSGAMTPDGVSIYFSRSVPRSYMYAVSYTHLVGFRCGAGQ